jgi:hypothetical protein
MYLREGGADAQSQASALLNGGLAASLIIAHLTMDSAASGAFSWM